MGVHLASQWGFSFMGYDVINTYIGYIIVKEAMKGVGRV